MYEEKWRAGFWRRALALAIDAVFLIPMVLVLEAVALRFVRGGGLSTRAERLFETAILALPLIYAVMEVVLAASPGKLLLGMRITNPDGSKACTATLLSRATVKWAYLLLGIPATLLNQMLLQWLSSLIGFVVLIGCFNAAGDSKLAWHDQWAHTAVFRIRRRGEPTGFEPVIASKVSAGDHAK